MLKSVHNNSGDSCNYETQNYRFDVYVPSTHVQLLSEALSAAGAGRFKNYDSCCFRICGKGQFRPLEGANPYIGTEKKIEIVEETKLEFIAARESVRAIVECIHQFHPYEEPAYQFWPVCLNLADFIASSAK